MSALAPWQQRIHDQVLDNLRAGRLGHGLLFAGPAGIGKRQVALSLARQLLSQGDATYAARAGQLIDAGTHPDLHLVSFIPNKSGDKLRTEIVIEQIRQLTAQLALTPQYGDAQVVIIDPADAINTAAANALLKTLEEPASGRYLWLLSSEPARLPATIRSRCQQWHFRLPAREQALAWLQTRGHDPALAAEALEAAKGHPGLADRWLSGPGWALRGEVDSDLQSLASGRTDAVSLAGRWSGDEHLAERLAHAADLALERSRQQALADPAQVTRWAGWFDAANRTRDLLRTTVRSDLAVIELLVAWRAVASDKAIAPGQSR